MPTAFDPLTGQEVDTASEAWRHVCECRALLKNYPTRQQKHTHLYGVPDREILFRFDNKAGKHVLKDDYQKLWPKNDSNKTIFPVMHRRGLDQADKILADARKLYEMK